jgi:hypothetical protein
MLTYINIIKILAKLSFKKAKYALENLMLDLFHIINNNI